MGIVPPDRATDPVPWTTTTRLLLAGGLVVAVAIRLVLLPTDGLRGDIDQFVVWVNHIANNGLSHAFDQNLSFGPVMAYIWGVLGALEPAFRTATDASDPWLRSLMKLPAVLADLGLAIGVAYALRARPAWAAIGAVAILLHPGTWYVSAWWGQYESVYMLAALAAALLAINGRNGLAAAALAVALMTKPQALPLLLPFAAWFVAHGGLTGLIRAAAIGAAVAVLAWAPFLAEGGPARYLDNLATYQEETFSILSVRAWNVWWLIQEIGAGGQMASDKVAIIGPITFRHIGYLVTGVFTLVVANRIRRSPDERTFLLGLAATILVAFTYLTTMHERYAYGALVFLMLLIPERRMRVLGAAFGTVFTLNLVAAIPALPELGRAIPVSGVFGISGSIAMIAITWLAIREARGPRS